jgi:hypothetical protein
MPVRHLSHAHQLQQTPRTGCIFSFFGTAAQDHGPLRRQAFLKHGGEPRIEEKWLPLLDIVFVEAFLHYSEVVDA